MTNKTNKTETVEPTTLEIIGIENYESVVCADCSKAIIFDCETVEEFGRQVKLENNKGLSICENCSDNYFICELCEDTIHSEDMNCFEDSVFCESCFDANYINCYECSDTVSVEDATENNGNNYCNSCYSDNFSHCSHCDDDFNHTQESGHEVGYETICNYCFSYHYFYCENCDAANHNDNYGTNGHCADCSEDEDEDEDNNPSRIDVIRSYSTDVLHTHSKDKGKRLFGVELEVGVKNNLTDIAQRTNKLVRADAILKSDCSISDNSQGYNGFEIVTRPMLATNQIKFWGNFLDNCSRQLRSYDIGSCGLHIHITRASLSQLTIGKLLVFLNDSKNENLVRTIAQRYSNGYSRREDKTFGHAKPYPGERYSKKGNRHEFVNLQNENTIEVRIFKGTLNRQRLMAILEFMPTLIEFLESASIRSLDTANFLNYVAKQPGLLNLKKQFELPLPKKNSRLTPEQTAQKSLENN